MKESNFTTYNSQEELENSRRIEASKTSYTERFHILMKLIKVSAMISNAKIISYPKLPDSQK